ncbi:hypothetical protein ABZ876_37670 [Streptomyces sp. NPDC046931]|uniref:hypothetical protein n=1 Tax=Streptomyces sp. NPDC046931 TaxID=3154806 RepID=UPI0033DEA6B9
MRRNQQMGKGMPDAPPLTPTVIDVSVSLVRLNGEACFDCVVSKTLRAAGHVLVRGNTRVWPIVTGGCCGRAAAA